MLRKIMIVVAMAVAFGGTMPATTAFARGGGGGHIGGGMGGGHFGGGHFGGGHFGGGHFGGRHFGGRHHRFARGFRGGFGFYDDYVYGSCYQTRRYHTRTGWHTRHLYACNYN